MRRLRSPSSGDRGARVATMSEIRIVEQRGSHLLIERNGRFAVIERRGNEVLSLAPGARREAPDTPEGMAEVVGPAGWPGEGRSEEGRDGQRGGSKVSIRGSG